MNQSQLLAGQAASRVWDKRQRAFHRYPTSVRARLVAVSCALGAIPGALDGYAIAHDNPYIFALAALAVGLPSAMLFFCALLLLGTRNSDRRHPTSAL
jgi:hypothetical protein